MVTRALWAPLHNEIGSDPLVGPQFSLCMGPADAKLLLRVWGLYEIPILIDSACLCFSWIINITAIKLVDLEEYSYIFIISIQELLKLNCATNKITFCLSICRLITMISLRLPESVSLNRALDFASSKSFTYSVMLISFLYLCT